MSDDIKGLLHAATAPIAERRELAGVIENLQRQLKIAVCDLDHIQASLRIFVPDLHLCAEDLSVSDTGYVVTKKFVFDFNFRQ